jgi:hypothetical protein
VSRQGRKPHARRAKPAAASSAGAGTISILPMDIQIGDRFTDEEGEWEVMNHPATLHGAKLTNSPWWNPRQPLCDRPCRMRLGEAQEEQ